MTYMLRFTHDETATYPLGKIVCVGRNYAEHARELNNPVPETPLLFMKPETAAVALDSEFEIPASDCHYEAELALLIQKELYRVKASEALSSVAGVGIALDLTRRELQTTLKQKGHPWEIAKAFDGSCPMSRFVPVTQIQDLSALEFELRINNEPRQKGRVVDMITPIDQLIAYMSQFFTLRPGDVILTGTPAGVGQLAKGDEISVQLDSQKGTLYHATGQAV